MKLIDLLAAIGAVWLDLGLAFWLCRVIEITLARDYRVRLHLGMLPLCALLGPALWYLDYVEPA